MKDSIEKKCDRCEAEFTLYKITTDWIGFSRLMADLQANYPDAPSVNMSMVDLEEQVEKYVNGDRATQQLELIA